MLRRSSFGTAYSGMDVPGFALITGAGSGIGRACALAFASEGCAGLALLDLNKEALETVENLARGRSMQHIEIIKAIVDVTDEKQVDDAVNNAAKQFGRLDYVVNCAGIGFKHEGGTANVVSKDWHKIIDINLNGTFYVLRAAAKIMLEQSPMRSTIDRREIQRGSIINLASILGKVAVPQTTAYVASKHGVVGLTKTASEDFARKGLRVNCICPGYIDTPLTRDGSELMTQAVQERSEVWTPMGRIGKPEEIADAVLFLAGGRSSYITGSSLMVDGGYTEH